MDNGYLDVALAWNRTYHQVFRTLNLVFLYMSADELYEIRSITFGLACSYARNTGKLLLCDGIGGSHGLKRRILENHIRRQIIFLRKLLS